MPIRFRKVKSGPEHQLVARFLNDYRSLFNDQGLQTTVFREPVAEVGIPDVLLVLWNKGDEAWHPLRSSLTRDDIKIVHFISTFGRKGTQQDNVVKLLGFSERTVSKTVNKLIESGLAHLSSHRIVLKNSAFFIRKIISVEAKVHDWRNAIMQAERNQNFSSHSYVLLPEEKINSSLLDGWNFSTGLLTYSKGKPIVKRRAQKNRIPGSYFSWMLNEYLGRQFIAVNNSDTDAR